MLFAELGLSDGGSLEEVGAGGVFAHGVHEIKDCSDAMTLVNLVSTITIWEGE